MLDKWFIEDINERIANCKRVVIVDKQNKCNFFLKLLEEKHDYPIFEVRNEMGELKAKYEIEKDHKNQNVIVFSRIGLDELTFIREYCETGSCLNIRNLHRYISEKVNNKMGFDIKENSKNIIAIGKSSFGRDRDFWKNVKTHGIKKIFGEESILKFLESPKEFFNSNSKEVKDLFIEILSANVDSPIKNKPAETVANEFMQTFFHSFIADELTTSFARLYKKWLDSKKYEKSLKKYLKNYQISGDINIWQLSSNHPFEEIDLQCLEEISKKLDDERWIADKLNFIKNRAYADIVEIIGVKCWKYVYLLLTFNIQNVISIKNMADACKYYTEKFYKLDNAMRHLYTDLLKHENILKPFQEYYENLAMQFLHKWFAIFEESYKENQTGLLKRIINENEGSIAIIVGDAISYEISQEIVNKLKSEYNIESNFVNANYPSVTDKCMSALFSLAGKILDNRKKRIKELNTESGKVISAMNLSELGFRHEPFDVTILFSADIDEISEKQNLKALKYYDKFIEIASEKIEMLLEKGYEKVYLTSDHGFVLTGLLAESDKSVIESKGGKISERTYISKTQLKEKPKNLIEIKEDYKNYLIENQPLKSGLSYTITKTSGREALLKIEANVTKGGGKLNISGTSKTLVKDNIRNIFRYIKSKEKKFLSSEHSLSNYDISIQLSI